MAGVADSAVGAILEIPPQLLGKIKAAESYIEGLGKTSERVSADVKKHWGEIAPDGLDTFIKKVREASDALGGVRMPKLDGTGFASSISEIASAMASVDKSATTGSKRIERIADAVSKLSASTPSYAAFKDIADGITLIGSTSDSTIAKVSALAATMATLARDIRTVAAARSAESDKTATASQYNKLYKEQADLVRQKNELERKGASITREEQRRLDAIKKRYAEIITQLDALNKKKQTAATELARIAGEQRVGGVASRTTVSGAIDYAKQAKSLKELQDAYKNLKAVMNTVDPKSAAWLQMNRALQQTKAQIDKVRKSMGELANQSQRTNDVMGKMKGLIATYFSVQAIKGFIEKMVDVRAEFELQNVALRAILQNKDEADRIFSQVQQMALQSPFTIMQMTTYTKQLAAYRIESEKLVGTTKMLADVSAGLGVDMGRLILAYGQVKSANYLRATEIRQFTEAGLNIAGELATYFSELQGKMVSVGEVMEMVTKRMVRFEDVEEVFKRVTSAGGIFYDMQKKQSETLFGQVQRIKDAYSIMLNDIGKSNQGAISWGLQLVRDLIKHWRMLVPILLSIGGIMASILATKMVLAMIGTVKQLHAAIKNLALAWKLVETEAQAAKAATATTWIGAAIVIIGTLASVLAGAAMEAKALNDELGRIEKEGRTDMNEQIFLFRQLADAITDSNKSYEERNQAMEDLRRIYKDILPDQMLEIEHLREMKNGYEEATLAIQAHYAERIRQKKLDAINRKYDEEIESRIDWSAKQFTREYFDMFKGLNAFSGVTRDDMTSAISNIAATIVEQIRNGEITMEEAHELFKAQFLSTFAISQDDLNKILAENEQNISQFTSSIFGYTSFDITRKGSVGPSLTDVLMELNKELGRVTTLGMPGVTTLTREAQPAIEKYEALTKAVEDYKRALQLLYDLNSKGKLGKISDVGGVWEMEGGTEKAADVFNNFIEKYKALQGVMEGEFGDWYNTTAQEITDAMTSNANMLEYFESVSKDTFSNVLQSANNFGEGLSENAAVVNWVETQTEAVDGLLTATEKQIIQFEKDVAQKFNVPMNVFDKMRLDVNTTFTDARKQAEDLASQYKETANEIQSSTDTLEDMGHTVESIQAIILTMYGITLADADNLAQVYDSLAKILGSFEKSISSGRGTDPWQKRVSLIKEINTEYEKLLKYYDEATAKAKIEASYAEAVAEAFKQDGKGIVVNGKDLSDINNWVGFDKQGMIAQLRAILDSGIKITPEKRAELQKMLAGLKAEVEIKVREDEIQKAKDEISKAFDNYELTKTLGSLGVNVELTYMVGGKPTTLADVRKQLEGLLASTKAQGGNEELVKYYEEQLRKVADLENKAAIERLKNYRKYLLESMSERIRIELNALAEINKFNQSEELDATTRQMAVLRTRQQMAKDLAAQEWKDFQDSESYIQLFENIEQASTRSIQYMLDRLQALRAPLKDLPPDKLRAVMKQIEKLETQINTRNPFKAFGDNIGTAIRAFKELGKAEEDLMRAEEKYETAKRTRDDYAAYTTQLEEQLSIERAKLGVNEFGEQIENDVTRELEKQVNERRENLALMNENVDKLEAEKNLIAANVSEYKRAKEAAGQALQKIGSWISETSSAIGDIANSLENVFGNMSDGMRDAVESMQEILGGVSDMMSGAGRFISGDYLGGSLQALKGLASTIGGLFAIGDKKKEREIQRLTDKVEELDKAYQKLEKSIDKAFSVSQYQAYDREMQSSIRRQMGAYREMLELEKSKKKSDDAKIKEYEDKLDELKEKQEELNKARHEWYGSTDDAWGEANDWVDAWLSAYKETGDGLSALNESWDEFYENLVKKQAASAVLGSRMDKWIKQINDAIDKNMGGSEYGYINMFKEIGEKMREQFNIDNEKLKKIFEYAGIGGGAGDLILSDLQKGIQNITEPQAAAIEAYLNSMRFAVFDQNAKLDTLISAIQAQYGSSADNPVVAELKGIRGVLDSIYSDLHSVVKTSVGKTYIQVG